MTWPARSAIPSVVAFLLLLGSAQSARGQWPTGVTVEGTPHNLTVPARAADPDMAGLVEDYGEVCVYCHGPHNVETNAPLWNRPGPGGGFRMYDDGQMAIDAQPTGNSRSCLSCHAGTVGLDEIVRLPDRYTGPGPARTTIDTCEDCHSGGSPDGGIDWEGVWLDTDLRKHHPISVLYDPSRVNGFRAAAEVEAAGLVLYDGKVQCMSCHEPHTQQFRPFLRLPNSGGSLCSVCHQGNPGENTAHDW